MDEQTCVGCGDSFTPSFNGRQIYCTRKCAHDTWVSNNREKRNQDVRDYRARRYAKEGQWRDEGPKAVALKAWMVELKSNPCHDCGGEFEVCCMDFDHRDGTVKEYNVGSMFAHHYSRELIQIEVDKCDLVCANCHRVRTRDGGSAKWTRTLGNDGAKGVQNG